MKFYYNLNGSNKGPVTLEELRALAEKGEIQPQTPVIESGKKEWMRWAQLEQSLESPKSAAGAPVQPAAPKKPVLVVHTTPLTAKQQAVSPGAPEQKESSFCAKIDSVYDKVDAALAKVCTLPKGLADTPEQSMKSMRVLNSFVGLGTLVCVLAFCLANGLYVNIKLLGALLLAGVVLQYICYQLYKAMSPLLVGRKIKLSSMGVPHSLALICLVGIAGELYELVNVKDIREAVNMPIFLILFAGVGYVSINARKFFVTLVPEGFSPGREMINITRFIICTLFTALHVLTPALMLIAAILLLANGHSGFKPSGNFVADMSSALKMLKDSSLFTIMAIVLPILSMFGFCLTSVIPDVLESIFSANDRKNS